MIIYLYYDNLSFCRDIPSHKKSRFRGFLQKSLVKNPDIKKNPESRKLKWDFRNFSLGIFSIFFTRVFLRIFKFRS